MSVNIKRARSTTAKLKAFAVDSSRNLFDTETGEFTNLNTLIAETFGEDTPVDIQVTLKSEEEVTPES